MNIRCVVSAVCIGFLCVCHGDLAALKLKCTPVDRCPAISPDYAGIVIPPAIAPLNFAVIETGNGCYAEFKSKRGKAVIVKGRGMSIRIPPAPWRALLDDNKGEPLLIDLYVRGKTGEWSRYRTIEDTIAPFPMDRYLTYRSMNFVYNYSYDLRIVERDLASFRESLLLCTKNYSWGCCNCHTPCNNDPARFVFQSRSSRFGSAVIIACNGKISSLDAKLGYPAWRPDGKMIAFSINKVQQCFHSAGRSITDFYDNNSDIAIYDVALGKIVSVPRLNQIQTLETWPNWSPDGRYLYFCSAPILWSDFKKVPPDNYNKVKFSLLRISYNEADGAWGAEDTVISSQTTGLSISQPRSSPDGRFILFCMHDRGGYPNTQESSDLYLYECAIKKYRRLNISSDCSESWHGWSSNGRWIVFSSKRDDGKFTRAYFSFVDTGGNAHKPFILPQDDPEFYDSYIKYFNFPEFAKAPVPFSEREILAAVRSQKKIKAPVPEATVSSAVPAATSEWAAPRAR